MRFIRYILLSTFLFWAGYMQAQNDDIVILYDNDVHCAVDGYARMGALKQQVKQRTDYVTTVSCGDFVAGGTLGAISKGEYIARIMNAVGYDCVVLGNHEFDYQVPQLHTLYTQLNAQILCCNFEKKGSGNLFPAYAIERYDDVDVAFIGITTPSTPTSSTPTYFTNDAGEMIYSFGGDTLWQHVQRVVDQCRAQGVKYVVVLSHLGDEGEEYTSRDLIAHTTGIDAVLDGHSHNVISQSKVLNAENKEVILSSTGAHFQNIGMLTIKGDGTLSTQLVAVESYAESNEAVGKVIENIRAEYDKLGRRVIGHNEVFLEAIDSKGLRSPRFRETNLGDFCADAARNVLHTEIGWINGGGIRANLQQGEITFNDIYAVFPFNNKLSVVEVSGQQILDALELGVCSLSNDNGAFLQTSGLRYNIDTTIQTSVQFSADGILESIGETRRVHSVEVYDTILKRYVPLNPQKNYSLAAFNYILFDHGNGFNFKDIKVVKQNAYIDIDLLEKYISTLGNTIGNQYASPSGNILFIPTFLPIDEARILKEVKILGNGRASDLMPLSSTKMDKEDLEDKATASSMPYIVEMEPSVVASGENGLVGNTSLRIRGVDATRINVNLNGISLNGAESHNFTWVNILGLSGMTESLQIQRGVGASSGGAATLGAAFNMKTLNPSLTPTASVNMSLGSWNTRQYGVTVGTGISKKGNSLDIAYNGLTSDGFVRGGFCDHQSLFLSATHYGEKSLLKAIAILGNHNTGITYYGASAEMLDIDPHYNSAGAYTDTAGNTFYYDRNGLYFFQRRYQLFYSYQLTPEWNITSVFDYTPGDGYEETYKDNAKANKYGLSFHGNPNALSDYIVRKEMHNASYTANLSANYEKGPLAVSLGENFLYYRGNHTSSMIWCQDSSTFTIDNPYTWYKNWGDKYDATTYAKMSYDIDSRLSLYADIQFRFVQFSMEGDDSDFSDLTFKENYPFFNPKVGLNYMLDKNQNIYFVAGASHREPTRADIKDRLNNVHASDTVKAETLIDFELGYQLSTQRSTLGINGYAMLYKDQLTPSGDLSSTAFDVLMENVDNSYRLGIELMGGHQFTDWFKMDGNLTLSTNKIIDYTFTDFVSGVDTAMTVVTKNTDLSYSPSLVGAISTTFIPMKEMKLQLNGKYVGSMYCDNTSREINKQDAYFLLNFKGSYTWKLNNGNRLEAQLAVNNLLNHQYRISASTRDYQAGGICYTSRTYYQQPGINFTARIALSF